VILLLDCDVPWIPSKNPPPPDTRIYHIDIDPLNQQIPVSFFPAHGRWKADCYTALGQLLSHLSMSPLVEAAHQTTFQERKARLVLEHKKRIDNIATRLRLGEEESLDASNIGYLLKHFLPESTVFVVEAVTCAQLLSDQLQLDKAGSWINCGGTGIGWSNGAALGVKMALDDAASSAERPQRPSLVCQVVGDGSFMCAAPSSALWVASKYNIPILTILLNNGGKHFDKQGATLIDSFTGFKAPKNSTQLVYPDGLNQGATDDEMNISFRPSPNYAALAEAASGSCGGAGLTQNMEPWMTGAQAQSVSSMRAELSKASERVLNGKKGMLIEALIP
jgi:thiamine pyrophosphate-dependent acetolactate synthase large subunit-like protein